MAKQSETSAKAQAESISKMGAIRKVIGKGIVAPKDVARHVKQEFDLDVTTGYVSTVKAHLKSKAGSQKTSKASGNLDSAVDFCENVGGIAQAKALLEKIERIKKL